MTSAEASGATAPETPGLAPGRDCGSCTLCCKVFRIVEVDKPSGQWCRHVVQGRGCGIHETRPEVCRHFFCFWRQNATLGPDWKPDRSKFVLYREMKGKRLVVASDPSVPTAWRRQPYYDAFKHWARRDAAKNHQILVFNGKRATAVLPDRDLDLGIVEVGDEIIYHVVSGRIEVEHRRRPPEPASGADGASNPVQDGQT